MPRARKGARLWLRPERVGPDGVTRQATFIILDGGRHFATGCAAHEAEGAERRLAAHIAAKYSPARRERDVERIDCADVLSIYLADKRPPDAGDSRIQLDAQIERLALFWGGKMLSEVTGESCREYVAERKRRGGARRDLEVFRAAINHHAEQGFHRAIVNVALPEKGDARDRWLTRSEAAKLIWTCWRKRETQTVHRGARRGEKVETGKRPLRHLARFILLGIYTGTRAASIAAASTAKGEGRSFVDLENGLFYRRPLGRRATKKRQPPAPIPPRLLAHLRRWDRLDRERDAAAARARGEPFVDRVRHVVEWRGRPVTSVKTGLASAVALAKLEGRVSPHTFRHTAATWLMQAGVDLWEAAGFIGMSVQMLDKVYGHHHPDHLKRAAHRIGYRHTRTSGAVVPLAAKG